MSATDVVISILGVMAFLVMTSFFVGRYRRAHDDAPGNGGRDWTGGSAGGGGSAASGCGGGGCGGGG